MIAGKFRFHGHGSLRYVYSKGQAQRSNYVTLKYVSNQRRKNHRFAVVISKKVLKSAVGRNRVRRRIYEYVRQNMHLIADTHDVVIICTSSELRSMPYEQFSDQLYGMFVKAGLFPEENTTTE